VGYYQHMKVKDDDANLVISRIAAAIGEPARVRILYCLLDGHARTSTELAVVADVTPSTTSVHLNRLRAERLVKVLVQGKHRFYSLYDPDVGNALEALSLVAGSSPRFVTSAPSHLLVARTCYDHMAGRLAVLLHNRFKAMGWLTVVPPRKGNACELSNAGAQEFECLGIDSEEARTSRRRFAYECLDWSERQPHLGGALGAALLSMALKKKWVIQDLDSRALSISSFGERQVFSRFGIKL
jgi:DNA-binding transcriptional ArsR family regulator